MGTWNEQHDQLLFAWNDYQAGIAKMGNTEKLALAPAAAFILNRMDDALRLLEPISGGPTQTEAAYYYGAALATTPKFRAAKEALGDAAKDPRYAVAAKIQLALLDARNWNVLDALPEIQSAAADPKATVATGAIEVALLRRAGQIERRKNVCSSGGNAIQPTTCCAWKRYSLAAPTTRHCGVISPATRNA